MAEPTTQRPPLVLSYTHRGRRPFPFRTAAVIAFVLPMLALWGRSYWRRDSVERTASTNDLEVSSDAGGIYVELWRREPADSSDTVADWYWSRSRASLGPWESHWGHPARRWAGVQWFRVSLPRQPAPVRVVIVSHWLVALAAAGLGLAVGTWLPRLGPNVWRRVRREANLWWSAAWKGCGLTAGARPSKLSDRNPSSNNPILWES